MFTTIIQVILAALKFPDAMRAFLLLLEKTPEEKRGAIVQSVEALMKESSESEDPKWDT